MNTQPTAQEIEAQKRTIIQAIKEDSFKLRDHAVRRSDERTFSRDHVASIVDSLLYSKYQPEKHTHWFIGYLYKTQTGGFAAVINDGIWIVTIFKRRLSKSEKALISRDAATRAAPVFDIKHLSQL